MDSLARCRQSLQQAMSDLSMFSDGRVLSGDVLDTVVNHSEIIFGELVALDTLKSGPSY